MPQRHTLSILLCPCGVFQINWDSLWPAVNRNHSSCPHQSSVLLWPRHPILSLRELSYGSLRREMVWRGKLSCSTLTTTTFIAASDTFTVDQDGSPRSTRLLTMMWVQRAARRHPSHQMCREFYWLSAIAVILHTCWACCTVTEDNSKDPGQEHQW